MGFDLKYWTPLRVKSGFSFVQKWKNLRPDWGLSYTHVIIYGLFGIRKYIKKYGCFNVFRVIDISLIN